MSGKHDPKLFTRKTFTVEIPKDDPGQRTVLITFNGSGEITRIRDKDGHKYNPVRADHSKESGGGHTCATGKHTIINGIHYCL